MTQPKTLEEVLAFFQTLPEPSEINGNPNSHPKMVDVVSSPDGNKAVRVVYAFNPTIQIIWHHEDGFMGFVFPGDDAFTVAVAVAKIGQAISNFGGELKIVSQMAPVFEGEAMTFTSEYREVIGSVISRYREAITALEGLIEAPKEAANDPAEG